MSVLLLTSLTNSSIVFQSLQNLTIPLSVKDIDISDDNSVIVIGDFRQHSTVIYTKDVDKFNFERT